MRQLRTRAAALSKQTGDGRQRVAGRGARFLTTYPKPSRTLTAMSELGHKRTSSSMAIDVCFTPETDVVGATGLRPLSAKTRHPCGRVIQQAHVALDH